MRFHVLGTLGSGTLIALAVGIEAALATADDAGRPELIGLAATAHISVLPAWLGIARVFGLPDAPTLTERVPSFVISVGTLVLAATATYLLLGMRGAGLRHYSQHNQRTTSSRPGRRAETL